MVKSIFVVALFCALASAYAVDGVPGTLPAIEEVSSLQEGTSMAPSMRQASDATPKVQEELELAMSVRQRGCRFFFAFGRVSRCCRLCRRCRGRRGVCFGRCRNRRFCRRPRRA